MGVLWCWECCSSVALVTFLEALISALSYLALNFKKHEILCSFSGGKPFCVCLEAFFWAEPWFTFTLAVVRVKAHVVQCWQLHQGFADLGSNLHSAAAH